jgi:imidazolonepropionase-like amidohydrolase
MRRALLALLVLAGPASARTIAIRAGWLFDGTGDAPRKDMTIVVRDDRIVAVGPTASTPAPAGADTIDLGGAFVLPGLIDCHTHLASRADQWDDILVFRQSPFYGAFAAVKNAEATLRAGFTTVRDVGSAPFLAVDLRESINSGYLVGPRVVASGPAISQTGGHGDLNGYAPGVEVWMYKDERDFAIADGVDQMRHVVRAQLKHGVDVIKVIASGGVLSKTDQPGAPQLTIDELRAAVEEAHAAGRKVAAHAHGTQGIKNAILAGVDSIEHGSLLDDEAIRLFLQRKTFLVADIYNDDYIIHQAPKYGLAPEHVDKEKLVGKLQRDSFARAVKAGVRLAFGTDAGVYPHGDNAKQFAYMVKFGMTPAAAIRAATGWAAELLGRTNDVGTVQVGRYADVIAVTADPLTDVRALESVAFVMKGGVVVKDELSRNPPR